MKLIPLISSLKSNILLQKISEYKGNMKESWKTINELLNKRSKSSNIDCIKDSGNATINKKEISNTINRFFCTIGENLASKIEAVPNPLLSWNFDNTNDNVKFKFRMIEVQEIKNAISKTKSSKSFGNDNISCYFLKLALPYIKNA